MAGKDNGGGAKKSAAKKAAAAPEKSARETTVAGFPLNSTISYGKGDDGKVFDAKDNNPKRRGAAERFARYAKCKTIADCLDEKKGGMKSVDVNYDIKNGFIVATAPGGARAAA